MNELYFLKICLIIFSYLIGSLSSAIITSKLMCLPDPRTQGSKNAGATNVLRYGGKLAAIFTLLGDFLKGFIPVSIAQHYHFSAIIIGIVACAALIGHVLPIFFRFKGGKGIATFLGILLALNWQLCFCALVIWLATALISRYSSLASLVMITTTPIIAFWQFNYHLISTFLLLMGIVIFIKHSGNIKRLILRTETKIKFKKAT